MTKMARITHHLWYPKEAEEAAEVYAGHIP